MPRASPQMMSVGKRHDATTVLFRPGNAEIHGLFSDHLTVPGPSIQSQHGAQIKLDADMRIGLETTFQNCVYITGQHAHTV